jgi:hypothetical protein
MTLRMMVLWGLALLLVAGVAQAQTGASGDLADCLRDNPDRYLAPGPAVDDQYAGPVDACQALIEGDGMQVTVTPAGNSDGPRGGSSSASSAPAGDAPSRGGSSGSPSTTTPATGTGTSGGTGAAAGRGTGPAAEAPVADSSPPQRAVRRAIAQADAAGGLGGPGSASGAPAWIIALGGALLAAIAGGAAFRMYRRGR